MIKAWRRLDRIDRLGIETIAMLIFAFTILIAGGIIAKEKSNHDKGIQSISQEVDSSKTTPEKVSDVRTGLLAVRHPEGQQAGHTAVAADLLGGVPQSGWQNSGH